MLTIEDIIKEAKVPLTPVLIWRMVRSGRFPAPEIRLTRKTAYWTRESLVEFLK